MRLDIVAMGATDLDQVLETVPGAIVHDLPMARRALYLQAS